MPTAPKMIRTYRPIKRQERRPNSHQRGYTHHWEKAARAWLHHQFAMGHVHCAECGKLLDGSRKDIHVDHIIDHKGDMDRFWDDSNWQALHAACHSIKTARENGFSGKINKVGTN